MLNKKIGYHSFCPICGKFLSNTSLKNVSLCKCRNKELHRQYLDHKKNTNDYAWEVTNARNEDELDRAFKTYKEMMKKLWSLEEKIK